MIDIQTIVFLLVVFLTILDILDVLSSYIAIKRGANEGNPLMKNMVKKWWKVILFKSFLLIFLWIVFIPFYLVSIWLIIPIDLFYIYVVISNFTVVYERREKND